MLADFTANANAEMQGRVQVARLYHMTDDAGVRDLLSFLLARDTMHQNQWIAAAAELRAEGYQVCRGPGEVVPACRRGHSAMARPARTLRMCSQLSAALMLRKLMSGLFTATRP